MNKSFTCKFLLGGGGGGGGSQFELWIGKLKRAKNVNMANLHGMFTRKINKNWSFSQINDFFNL